MKKVLFLTIALAILLCSCSLITPQTQDFSITLDSEFADNIVRSVSRNGADTPNFNKEPLDITVTLTGKFRAKQTAKTTINEMRETGKKITFMRVPFNKKFNINVKVCILGDDLIYEANETDQIIKNPNKVSVELEEKTEIEYVLTKAGEMGLFKPTEILDATEDDFIKYSDDVDYIFSTFAFDNKGNLWGVRFFYQNHTTSYEMFYKVLDGKNKDFIPVQLFDADSKLITISPSQNSGTTAEYVIISHLFFDEESNTMFVLIDEEVDNGLNVFAIPFEFNDIIKEDGISLYAKKNEKGELLQTVNIDSIINSICSNKEILLDKGVNIHYFPQQIYNNHYYLGISSHDEEQNINSYLVKYDINGALNNADYSANGTDINGFISFSNDTRLAGKNLIVQDMIARNNKLYVLVTEGSVVTNTADGTISYSQWASIGDLKKDNENITGSYNSYGAILQIDIEKFEVEKVLGLAPEKSKEYKAQIYQYNNPLYTAQSLSKPLLKTININTRAPTKANSNLLFGPYMFIAIKPKKLVFEDTGLFLYEDGSETYGRPINRIVTVDLEKFVISSTKEVKINFGNYYYSGGSQVNLGLDSIENLWAFNVGCNAFSSVQYNGSFWIKIKKQD